MVDRTWQAQLTLLRPGDGDLGDRLLVVAPHMDDGVLGCGGLIGLLPSKDDVHFAYVTDGATSPPRVASRPDDGSPEIARLRRDESIAALDVLGVPADNVHFLDLPERRLRDDRRALATTLGGIIGELRPSCLMMPFRYDRHPDHLAVNRVLATLEPVRQLGVQLLEYFVYFRWRLLRGGDIRAYIAPRHLIAVDIRAVAATKRQALDCFRTQVAPYFEWQRRPVLNEGSLTDACRNPEVFLKWDRACAGDAVFRMGKSWIRTVHAIEPRLKRLKYRVSHLYPTATDDRTRK